MTFLEHLFKAERGVSVHQIVDSSAAHLTTKTHVIAQHDRIRLQVSASDSLPV